MPRKQNNIFYIYKTTNLVNKKYYIGKHCTTKIENEYLGSGKRLRYSIRKYGVENFKKEILEFCKSKEELRQREQEIVNEEIIKDKLCMNLMCGGTGGDNFSYKTEEEKLVYRFKKSEIQKNWIKENLELFKLRISKISKQKKENFNLGLISGAFKNKKHTEESKNKMSNSHKGKGLKEFNSQYGTIWITNGVTNKKIKSTDMIPNGYYKGRI